MKILGVAHKDERANEDYNYIVSHKPKKVLLELDPVLKLRDSYFNVIKNRLLEEKSCRGIEVIEGDIYLHEFVPEVFYYEKEEAIEKFRRFSENERNKIVWNMVKKVYSPRSINRRNEGLIKEIYETNPDLVVVGAFHAPSIKKKFKDADLEFLYKGDFYDYTFFLPASISLSLSKLIKPNLRKISGNQENIPSKF